MCVVYICCHVTNSKCPIIYIEMLFNYIAADDIFLANHIVLVFL